MLWVVALSKKADHPGKTCISLVVGTWIMQQGLVCDTPQGINPRSFFLASVVGGLSLCLVETTR